MENKNMSTKEPPVKRGRPRKEPGPKKKEPEQSILHRLYERYRNVNMGMMFLYVFVFIVILKMMWTPVMNYFELEDDSITEEVIEYVIESQTGIEIDLSPEN